MTILAGVLAASMEQRIFEVPTTFHFWGDVMEVHDSVRSVAQSHIGSILLFDLKKTDRQVD